MRVPVYIEVLIQIWLKSRNEEMSELLDKQVNVRGSRKLQQAPEKVCDENEHMWLKMRYYTLEIPLFVTAWLQW